MILLKKNNKKNKNKLVIYVLYSLQVFTHIR